MAEFKAGALRSLRASHSSRDTLLATLTLSTLANSLYADFFTSQGQYELNIPANVVDKVRKAHARGELTAGITSTDDDGTVHTAFDDAVKSVTRTITQDSLRRFLLTKEWKEYYGRRHDVERIAREQGML